MERLTSPSKKEDSADYYCTNLDRSVIIEKRDRNIAIAFNPFQEQNCKPMLRTESYCKTIKSATAETVRSLGFV